MINTPRRARVANITHTRRLTLPQYLSSYLVLALVPGIVSALLTKGGDYLVARRQQRHQTEMQQRELEHKREILREEQTHQMLQLLIAAHDKARKNLLQPAVDTSEWLLHELYTLYGLDHEYSTDYEPRPSLSSPTEVISALRRIEKEHPTSLVRKMAGQLSGNIASHYAEIYEWSKKGEGGAVAQTGRDPSEDELSDWIDKADELIELIHTPPGRDQVAANVKN